MYLWLLLWVPLTGVCLHSLRLLRDTWQLGRPQGVLPASAEHWKRDMAAHTLIPKTSFRVSQIMFISLSGQSKSCDYTQFEEGRELCLEEGRAGNPW